MCNHSLPKMTIGGGQTSGMIMDFGPTPTDEDGETSESTTMEFGYTHVKMPKGVHQATIVWLHGLADDGSTWAQMLESFPVHNVKWICPTAPICPFPLYAKLPGRAWFDPRDISESEEVEERDYLLPDLEGLNKTAAHIADIFSREPPDVKLGIGGFSIGGAAALYAATHYILNEGGDKVRYVHNLTSVIVLSGWLPFFRTLKEKLDVSTQSAIRVKQLHTFLCHGNEDDVVSFEYGERCAYTLHSAGFENLAWKRFERLGHDTCASEFKEMCKWIDEAMGLQGW